MEVINKLKERFNKSPKLLAYAVIGIVCLLILGLTGKSTEAINDEVSFPQPESEYAKEVEKKLEEIISEIDGVGKISVMVTVEGTVKYEYQTDASKSESRDEFETVIISNKTPLIKSIENPKISGVLVICDGGDSVKIREKVIYAVSTVLDIPTNKVYITR